MLIPGPARKAVVIGEAALTLQKLLVYCTHGAGVSNFLLYLGQGLLISTSRAGDRVRGILHGRKVQEGRNFLSRWRYGGVTRVECRLKQAFIELTIAFANLVLLVFQQFLQVFDVFLHSVGEIGELKG